MCSPPRLFFRAFGVCLLGAHPDNLCAFASVSFTFISQSPLRRHSFFRDECPFDGLWGGSEIRCLLDEIVDWVDEKGEDMAVIVGLGL